MSTQTHTAIATTSKGKVDAIDVPTHKPGPGQVLIKVEYASLAPFESYQADLGVAVMEYPSILAFDAAGEVIETGSGVEGLSVGDKVAGMDFTGQVRAMQQYVVLSSSHCAKLPPNITPCDSSTIPGSFVTAYHALFNVLRLPYPAQKPDEPVLVYGGASSTGQFHIQLLRTAGYRNVITTASKKHHKYLRSIGATKAVDYRDPVEEMQKAIGKVKLAVDSIASFSTLETISKFVEQEDSKVAFLIPVKRGNQVRTETAEEIYLTPPERSLFPFFSEGVQLLPVMTFLYITTQNDQFFQTQLLPKVLPELIEKGQIVPNRVRLLESGSFLERVEEGLKFFRENKVSGEKIVVKVP